MAWRGKYGEDDFYDEEGDYYEEEGNWEDQYDEQVEAKPAKAAAAPAKPKAPAAAAGASSLARSLCDPPPPQPGGKLQRGAKAKPPAAAKQGAYPIAPPAAPGDCQQFDFSTPSPDDEAGAAAPERRNVGIPLAPSRTPTVKAAKEAAQATKQAAAQKAAAASEGGASSAAAAAAVGVQGLTLHGGGALEAGGEGPGPRRRKLSEYVLEPELARDVDAALAAEASGAAGHRSSLHLVVAGHVDAGKSTLMGRLLHDLGLVTQKEAHKNLKEATQAGKASFSWAWVLDERPEERSRGVTVDVAMARFQTPRYNVTLLDAPGHRDFVPNMISGAAQADAALLVVDGSVGGFEAGFGDPAAAAAAAGGYGGGGGQTREHAQLTRSLGVDQMAVVITKLDTCGFSQERFDHIKSQLLPFLKSCGFKESLLQWLPAAAPSGQNLAAPPTDAALLAWWRGPTLVGAIDAFEHHSRNAGLPLRLPIHDVTRTKAGGLGVGGKLESGAVRVGSRVALMPGGEVGAVKSIEVNGKPAQLACAGDSADMQISGIDPASAHAGAVLCHPLFPARVATRLEARVLVLDVPTPLLRGQSVTLHCHTAREEGAVSALVALLDGKTGEELRKRPRCLLKGQTAVVEITPARPVVVEEFSELRGMGRVALRDGGHTLGVGIITKVLAEK